VLLTTYVHGNRLAALLVQKAIPAYLMGTGKLDK